MCFDEKWYYVSIIRENSMEPRVNQHGIVTLPDPIHPQTHQSQGMSISKLQDPFRRICS